MDIDNMLSPALPGRFIRPHPFQSPFPVQCLQQLQDTGSPRVHSYSLQEKLFSLSIFKRGKWCVNGSRDFLVKGKPLAHCAITLIHFPYYFPCILAF